MPAPEWLTTQAGDLVNVSQINTIQVVGSSVKLSFMNGQTLNYQFEDAAAASAWFAAYFALIGPTPV